MTVFDRKTNKNDCSRVFSYIFCTFVKTKRSLIPLLIRFNVVSSFSRNYRISDAGLLSKITFYFFWLGFLFQNNQKLQRIMNHFRSTIGPLPVTWNRLNFKKSTLIHSKLSFKIKLAFFIKIFIRLLRIKFGIRFREYRVY